MFHHGEKKRKKKKILRSFSLKIDQMILFCRSSFPSSEGGRSYAVFFIFPSLLRRVSESREGRRVGPTWFSPSIWLTRPRLTTSFRSDIIRVSRISISASLFTAYSYYMYVSAKPGTFGWGERGLQYHVTVCARLLGYCIYVYLGSHPSSLEDFPPCGAWRVLQSIRCRDWESVGAGSSALLLCGFLCMVGLKRGISRMIRGGKVRGVEGGQAPLHSFLRLFCACMVG